MTCRCSMHSPFLWHAHPRESIFFDQTGFRCVDGRSQSQISSASADGFMKKYGRSLGTVPGVSTKADAQVIPGRARRLAVAAKGKK